MTKDNLFKIKLKFSSLVSKTSDQLQEKKTDISKLQRSIITSFSITHEGIIAEFKAAGDVASLFDLLTRHGLLSYKNYHFLTAIINEFIPDLKADMAGYKNDYVGYQVTTNLERHLAADTNLVNPNPELFSSLKITVPLKLSERSLKYIEELWESLLEMFKLPPYQLLQKIILGGSISIIWCFPQCETPRIIEVVKSSSQFFSDHSIEEVSVNNEVLYKADAERGSRSPVRGPSDRGHYRSRSPVRGPSDRGHYRSRSPVRGPSDRGHYRSQSPVRGPSDRGHYRSRSPVRGASDGGHYRSQSPVRGPSDRGHYRSQSPVRGPSDWGHYRSRSPVRGSSDRGHYRSRSPARGPSDRGHYRSRSPARGPSDRGHYRSRSPVRGSSDRGHYRSRSPVRGPSDRGHYRSRSPVRGPSDKGHYRSRSPVRGPSDRGHYRSQSPVRGPSDRGHYRSRSPVRGPSDRGHYRSRSPVRGSSDRGHYRSRSPVRWPSDRGHYRSRSPVRGPSDRGHYRSRSPVRGPSDRGYYRSQSPVRGPSDRGHYPPPSLTTHHPQSTPQPTQSLPPSSLHQSVSSSDQSSSSLSAVVASQSSLHHTQLGYVSTSHTQTDGFSSEYGAPPAKRCHLQTTSSHSHINTTSKLMTQFIDYVRTVYKTGSEVERDTKVVKWPPTLSKVFINLACIDRKSRGLKAEYDDITEAMVRDGNVDVVEGKKWQIDFSQIACGLPATTLETVILVEGAPGVGKSTFAWEFCRRWERGEIAQQYQLVLLLRLRDERMSRAKSLRNLIYHSSESVCQAVVEDLECSCGHKTLLILEGFDELPDTCRTEPSVFLDLIYGQLLPMATVMVTSRPWATSSLHGKCSHRIFQHIEILGFRSQQITSYIRSTLSESEAVGLEHYLERHPQIRMCMYIPLNSAIVVTVYQESQDGTVHNMPTTRTELYTALARTLLLRYMHGHREYESSIKPMKTFNDLPPVMTDKFSELCKLAYGGITSSDHVQLIFNDSDLPSDFDSLGFMDSVTELYVTQGTVSSHNFLHLTFQEFLAAVHISTMSPSDQLEHFLRHEDGRYRVVLRFLAGLTKLTCFSKDTIKNIFTDTGRTGSPYSVACDVGVTIDLVDWMFEAHSDDVISLLERKLVNIYSRYNNEYLSYYSLGYCIAHSQCQWVLPLDGDNIGEEEVRMLVGGASTRQEASGRVVGLRGGWDDEYDRHMPLVISAEGLNMLFTQWKSVLHLHELYLDLPVPCDGITWPDLSGLRVLTLGIWKEENWRLDSLLPHLSLESLIITVTEEGYFKLLLEDCDAIGLHNKSTTCLKELCVTLYDDPISIDDKGMEIISKALSDNQSLPLERLELECEGTFTDTAADCLAQFITNTTTLQHFTIHHCTFSAHGLLALAQALHHNSTLQEKKSLEELTVTVDGDNEAKDYAQLLVEYPYMVDNIDWERQEEYIHNISDDGAVALAHALHHNCTLKELDLSNNNISDGGAVALAHALHRNCTLERLDLSNNSISDAGAVALAQALHHNSTLERLYLYGNDVIGKVGYSSASTGSDCEHIHHQGQWSDTSQEV